VRYLLGNVKKYGNLSFEDLMIIQTMILNDDINHQFPFEPEDYIIADLNKDGRPSSLELRQIQRLILGIGYSYVNNTINIERGDTITKSFRMSTINPVKISSEFSLNENCAYGLRFNSDATGNIIYGTYAIEKNMTALNGDYIGFFIDRYINEEYFRIYIYQDFDGIYMLRCSVKSEIVNDELVETFNFNVSQWGTSIIEEFYEIKTSD
jgi:hypothetical protein